MSQQYTEDSSDAQQQPVKVCDKISLGICPSCRRDKLRPFEDGKGSVRMCLTGFDRTMLIAE